MIHTATLLHDDVVDESELRRGIATANATFGNAASVLVGDFLYSRAFQLMVGVGSMRVLDILSNATNVIAEGEVLQLMNSGDPALDEATYLGVIRRKTAKLFEAAAELGATLGDAAPDVAQSLARYGMHLGTAFQLVDDVLDYSGELSAIGKNLGDDLAEGKMTLPLIRAIAVGDAADAALIRDAITRGRLAEFAAGAGRARAHRGARLRPRMRRARKRGRRPLRRRAARLAGSPESARIGGFRGPSHVLKRADPGRQAPRRSRFPPRHMQRARISGCSLAW